MIFPTSRVPDGKFCSSSLRQEEEEKEEEEEGTETAGEREKRETNNATFSPYKLSLIVASLCTSHCSFILATRRLRQPAPRSREVSHFSVQAVPFGNGCFPCFAPGSLRYDVVKFYCSQNFLQRFQFVSEYKRNGLSRGVTRRSYFNFFSTETTSYRSRIPDDISPRPTRVVRFKKTTSCNFDRNLHPCKL